MNLREEIAARKHKRDELTIKIMRKADQMRDHLGYSIRKIAEIDFGLIADIAVETASLKEEYDDVMKEIEQGEKELRG